MQQSSYKFPKEEKLCSKKLIDQLFEQNNQIKFKEFPLLMVAKKVEDDTFSVPCQALFVVGKKKIRRAVKRNFIKRRIKEAYRLNKNPLYQKLVSSKTKYTIAFIYLDNKPANYPILEKKIIVLLERLKNKIEISS